MKVNNRVDRSPIYVSFRPGVKEFLQKMEHFYEIVIFTASIQSYADPIIDEL